jgi:hypothetical protein
MIIVITFPMFNTLTSSVRIRIIFNLAVISGSAVLDNADHTELCVITERCRVTDELKHVRGVLTDRKECG